MMMSGAARVELAFAMRADGFALKILANGQLLTAVSAPNRMFAELLF
jgi:hypothetical protein